ncbi:hypothetical protein EB796_005070 [Bugula neritina]|uniref:Uncharacterized protein n=1 Tax=Bugula neritina TaxID=10212 RepID=A0A7J7KEJ1_BUGNE|nr:hypothetical protein EB796_005070 [Bugula neritina]
MYFNYIVLLELFALHICDNIVICAVGYCCWLDSLRLCLNSARISRSVCCYSLPRLKLISPHAVDPWLCQCQGHSASLSASIHSGAGLVKLSLKPAPAVTESGAKIPWKV